MNFPNPSVWIVVIIVLLSCQSSFAQTHFVSGYIITSQGDSVRGYIDYRNWAKNPDKVSFKNDVDASAVVYTPATIQRFGMAEEHYVAAIVEIETSPRSTNQLKETANFEIHIDTVFLISLVNGSKSLYCLRTTVNQDLFYVKKQTGEYELLYYKQYLSIDAKNSVVARNAYKSQLKEYMHDCPDVHSVIDRASYNISSLQHVFARYYSCRGKETPFTNEQFKPQFVYGAIGGFSHNSLMTSGVGPQYVMSVDFDPSMGVSVGGFLDFKFPRSFKKWSLYNDLTFNTSKLTGENWAYATTLHLDYLRLSTMIRYQHPFTERYSLFLNGGMANGFMLGAIELEVLHGQDKGKHEAEGYRKHEQGIVGGAGFTFGKFGAELRVERSNGFSHVIGMRTINTRFYGLLSYRL